MLDVITQIRIDALTKQIGKKTKYLDYLRTQTELTERDLARLHQDRQQLKDAGGQAAAEAQARAAADGDGQ